MLGIRHLTCLNKCVKCHMAVLINYIKPKYTTIQKANRERHIIPMGHVKVAKLRFVHIWALWMA